MAISKKPSNSVKTVATTSTNHASTTGANTTASPLPADDDSDYGSEIDDLTALDLLSQIESQPLKNVVLESIEDPILKDNGSPQRIHVRVLRSHYRNQSRMEMREASVEVEYDEGNRTSFSPSNLDESQAKSPEPEALKNDSRPPIERFRSRKPLSVTDIASPAWCEQQYEYSLSKYGRVRKTPAMKQGSTVHKELEEQVYVRVPVEAVSKEDRFGLRMWNTIQGLRTLRDTGLTRELEVWGVLEGEVVIGIIDEIRTICPDDMMESQILEDAKKGKGKKGKKTEQLPADQRTLKDFLTASQNASVLENHSAFLGTLQERPRAFYLVDVKTRQSRTLPGAGSQSRPTHMQLMVNHRLLSSLATNEVLADKVFERYKLQPDAPFSDKFIAEVANLDIGAFASVDAEEDFSPNSTQIKDPLTELLEHNTLSSLWTLLTTEFARTFPTTANQSTISPLLTAEFRTGRTRFADAEETEVVESAGTLIGRRSFAFDAARVDEYVREKMRWWRGERETQGVDVEEAYKCRICEFADGCAWRATKVEEGLRKAKLRSEARRRSEV